MVATTADKVVVELEAAMNDFNRDVTDAGKKFEQALDGMVQKGVVTEKELKEHFKGFADGLKDSIPEVEKTGESFGEKFITGFIRTVVTGIIGGGFLTAIVAAARQMSDLEDTARRASIPLEKFQELLYAVRVNGVGEGQALKDVQRIVDLIADAAGNPRNSLRRLFEVNGITIGGKNAEEVIMDLARLMQNAPEGAKGKIADLAGVSRDWIQILEKGPDAIVELMHKADEAGAVLDELSFKKAAEFKDKWNEATTRWGDLARTTISDLLPLLDTLITKALEFTGSLARGANTVADMVHATVAVVSQDVSKLEALTDRQLALARHYASGPLGTADALAAVEREQYNRANRPAPTVTIHAPPSGKGTTVLPGREQRGDSFDREAEAIIKRTALFEAEAQSIGKTNYERDRAKAFTELMTAAQKAYGDSVPFEVVERIHELADGYAAAAQRVRETKDAWEAANALAREFGNQAISGIEGLIAGTKTLNQVLGDVLKSLANMALKAAILGEGPLASFFGTKSASGGVGGLMGGILGAFGGFRAAGGGVTPGKSYVVGEKGPEFFTPSVAGYISPNGASMGGGGPRVSMFNDFRDASAAAIPALMQRIAYLERNFPNMVAPALRNERRTNPWAV